MGGLGGVPWELALLVVGLDLLGLSEGCKTIVPLVPRWRGGGQIGWAVGVGVVVVSAVAWEDVRST